MLTDLNNVQQTDISDINERCIPINILYLTSPRISQTDSCFGISLLGK